MAIEVFNRYEHKYLINLHQFDIIKRLVEQYMVLDAYNKNYEPYTISNLYFDTTDDFLIRTSLGKPKYKEKLRMRAYGIPKADAHVFLEIKKKFKGLVNKRRTELKLGEAYEFVKSKKANHEVAVGRGFVRYVKPFPIPEEFKFNQHGLMAIMRPEGQGVQTSFPYYLLIVIRNRYCISIAIICVCSI